MYCIPYTQSSLLLMHIFDITYSSETDTLKNIIKRSQTCIILIIVLRKLKNVDMFVI